MRRFLFQLLLFLVLQAVLLGLLLIRYDVTAEANYLAAVVDKHRRLRSVDPPRVILVGGSNVPFGFESDRIEQALGRPVVNMGLAAGVGAEFMLNEINGVLSAGDIVVLSLEYDHFARGLNAGRYSSRGFDPNILQQVLVFRPAGVVALGMTHVRKIVLDRGLNILGEIVRRSIVSYAEAPSPQEEAPSTRRAFNARGDLAGHRREVSRTTPELVNQLPLVADVRGFPNAALVEIIREFVKHSQRDGVHVVFTFTPKPRVALQREGELARRLADALRTIPGLTLLDTPQEHVYPPEQFFDTANHLTAAGTAARTAKVIRALQEFIANMEKR